MIGTRTLQFAKAISKQVKLCYQTKGVRCLSSSTSPGDIVGYKSPKKEMTYKAEDVILYNIAVGASLESAEPQTLRYVYEGHANFSILPTFGTLTINSFLVSMYEEFPIRMDFSKLFHGEHYLELKQPLNPKGGTLVSESTVVDAVDKGKGTLLVIDIDTKDTDGKSVIHNQTVIFTTQFGKWGGKRSTDKINKTLMTPERAPDVSVSDKMSLNQAALYRLTGDNNLFHIDPEVAARGGFPRPVLHGLCSYGFSARNIIEKFCDFDTSKFKSSKLRFSSPVLPGHTIRTDMWKEPSRIHFTTTNVDTGKVAISGGHIDLSE